MNARLDPDSRRCRLALFVCLTAALLFCSASLLQAQSLGKTHTDKELGFSIRVPKDWDFVASKEGEKYIVATFTGERLLKTKKFKEWADYGSHRPRMRIIAFTPENVEMGDGAEGEEEFFGKKVKVTYAQENPYKDFKEYVKRTITGFYFGDEEESKVKKVECTRLDVFWHEARPPLRRTACIYHVEDMDIAVYFDVMEEWFPKYESFFKKTFKTFKTVKREYVAEDLTKSDNSAPMTREEFIIRKTATLPEGWTHKVSKSHLIFSHAPKKYTEKIAKFADAMRAKIRKDFAKKGPKRSKTKSEDDVKLPIIRVCASPAEYDAFIDTGGGQRFFNEKTQEVVVYDGTRQGYDIDWTFSRIGGALWRQFISEEFKYLRPESWYVDGMGFYYRCFKLKGSSCKFVKDTWLNSHLREGEKNGECKRLKDLMACNNRGIGSNSDYLKVGYLACFLNSKDGNKKPYKGILDRYYENFKCAYEEFEEMMGAEIHGLTESAGAGDEDDEDDAEEEFARTASDMINELRQQAYKETFADWDDDDWKKLEKAFLDWAI